MFHGRWRARSCRRSAAGGGAGLVRDRCLASRDGRGKLEALLVCVCFAKKGWNIQFNPISSETLRAAQAEPEKYRDLAVRAAGYGAPFGNLEPATRGDIVACTGHLL